MLVESDGLSESGSSAVAGCSSLGARHELSPLSPSIRDLSTPGAQPLTSAKVPVFPDPEFVSLVAACAACLAATWIFAAVAMFDAEDVVGMDAVCFAFPLATLRGCVKVADELGVEVLRVEFDWNG